MRWAPEAHTHSGGSLPAGGSTGQVLTKDSGTSGDASWHDLPADSWPYRGSWDSGTAYVAGDVVERLLGVYQAVSASTGSDPAVPAAPTAVGSLTGSGVNMGNVATAQEFTTSSDVTLYGVKVYANYSSIPSGSTVAIKSGSPTGTVIASVVTTSAISSSGQLLAFSSPVSLPAGTYWLTNTGRYAKGVTEAGTTISGIISSQGRMWTGAGWSNTSLQSSYNIAFDLYEQPVNPWEAIIPGGMPSPVTASGASSNTITATSWADIPSTSVTLNITLPARMRVSVAFSAWMSLVAGTTSSDLRCDWKCVDSSGTVVRGEADSGWGAILYQSVAVGAPTLVTSRASNVMVDLNAGTYTFTLRAYRSGSGGTMNLNYPRLEVFPVCYL